jgi:hypothetical protein
MLTHVHKVKHLVAGTFEQGWRSLRLGDAVSRWLDATLVASKLGNSVRSVACREGELDWLTGLWSRWRTGRVGLASGPYWRTLTQAVLELAWGAREGRTRCYVWLVMNGRVWSSNFLFGAILESIGLHVAGASSQRAARQVAARWQRGSARADVGCTASGLLAARPISTWPLGSHDCGWTRRTCGLHPATRG